MAAALEVTGELSVEQGGDGIRVRGRGDVVVVELPTLRAGRKLMALAPRGPRRRAFLLSVQESLVAAGLRVEVRFRGRAVAVLGAGARRGWLPAVLGLGPFEVRALPVLWSWWRGPFRPRRGPG